MISKLPKVIWPKGAFVDTIKIWQQEWFYITEPHGTKWVASPAFRSEPPLRVASWTNKGLDWGSSDEVLMLKKSTSGGRVYRMEHVCVLLGLRGHGDEHDKAGSGELTSPGLH